MDPHSAADILRKQDAILAQISAYKTDTDAAIHALALKIDNISSSLHSSCSTHSKQQQQSNYPYSLTAIVSNSSDSDTESTTRRTSLLSTSPVPRSFLSSPSKPPPAPVSYSSSQKASNNQQQPPHPLNSPLIDTNFTSFNENNAANLEPSVPSSPIYKHRIILTTYPGQVGINPIPLCWAAPDPHSRGPIVASRHPSSMKYRNAIGAHGGSYSVYRALAIAIRELQPDHKPNLHNTEPVVHFGPFPSWSDPTKIVSIDPWGADIEKYFSDELARNIDVRPTIALTRAHMRVAEIEKLVHEQKLSVDGKIVVSPAGELMVTKGAVDPVWFLPGVAARFNVDEITLRRALFEDTGGMYPELITRPDLQVFLPPIGNISIYIFGNPLYLSDPTKRLTLRVHDECNGSDVFGSDICTCRPYLIYGIEEAVREAQKGGVGLIVYFRKEGRALGEVTKYLVYNARKRAEGGDTAQDYFLRTENIAGVKDMRFQALMPDVLHWLGIQKIDRMISMSNMKHDAIVGSGIPILERVEIPDGMLPPDSKVEIDAKIAAGYFSTHQAPIDLAQTKGRNWDDINH